MFTYIKDKIQGKIPSGHKRASDWSEVRAAFLKDNPFCAACGGTEKLEVHHRIPFHMEPSRERDPLNLITLCESGKHGINCHLLIGHRGNYKKANPNVQADADYWHSQIAAA